MIGQTRSWLCWLAGALCALIFGANASAGEAQAKYGVQLRPIRPPAEDPAMTEEQKQKAEKLVAEYLSPTPAGEPSAELKATVEKLLKDFGSADFKTREDASLQAAKLGPAALGLLRDGAKAQDAEVASRAGSAVAAIENAARQGPVAELKKIPGAARLVIMQQISAANQAERKAQEEFRAAESKNDRAAAEKSRAEQSAAVERRTRLTGLMAAVAPIERAVAVYGIRAPQPID